MVAIPTVQLILDNDRKSLIEQSHLTANDVENVREAFLTYGTEERGHLGQEIHTKLTSKRPVWIDEPGAKSQPRSVAEKISG